MHGDSDKLVPVQYGELAHNAFTNSVYIVVPGGEHGFAPNEETAAVVDNFYQKREVYYVYALLHSQTNN
ncbi:MAG TPA: hypothetical protein GXX75_16430 [Clostridiales bacterium]|nr:hypothetical protein [Clostridiales bacterium]